MSKRTEELASLFDNKYGTNTPAADAAGSGLSQRQQEIDELFNKKQHGGTGGSFKTTPNIRALGAGDYNSDTRADAILNSAIYLSTAGIAKLGALLSGGTGELTMGESAQAAIQGKSTRQLEAEKKARQDEIIKPKLETAAKKLNELAQPFVAKAEAPLSDNNPLVKFTKSMANGELTMGESAQAAIQGKSTAEAEAEKAARQKANITGESMGRLLGELGINAAQMGLDALTGPAALLTMGARATGGRAIELADMGKNETQQLVGGLTSGLIEVLTEKIGGPFQKIYGKTALSKFAGDFVESLAKSTEGKITVRLLADFVEEGMEEVLSDVLNPIADKITGIDTNKDWSFNSLYGDDWAQVWAHDFLTGGLLGLGGGGVSIATNAIETNARHSSIGEMISAAENGDRLIEAAKKAGGKSAELANKITKATPAKLGGLYETMQRQTMLEGIVEHVGDETAAKAITNALQGKELTARQSAAMESETAQQAYREIVIALNGTVTENNAWAGDMLDKLTAQNAAAFEPEELPAEVYEPMTYDEQEDFIRDKYSDAISEGILTEDNIQNIVKELKGGTPIESMVRRTDSYVKQQSTLREQEKSLRDRYAEAVKEGLLEQEDIDGLIDTLRGGTPAETLIQQTDEILEVLRDGKNGADGSLGRDSDDGAGESGGGVSEAAGRPEGQERRDDTGREEARGSDSKGNERKIPEKVSGRELKIPGGTDNKTMSVVKPSGIEARIVKAFMPAAKSITLVKGDIEQETKGGIVKVSGLETSDGRIWARMDHRMYSGTKLLLHECGHLYMRDDAELRRKMHEAAKQVMTEDAIDKLAVYYSKIWKGLYKLPEGVTYDTLGEHFDANPEALAEFLDIYQQEIWCDALAGLDRANAPGASKLTDAIRAVFLQETGIDIEGILNGTATEETETEPAQGRAAEVEERAQAPPVYSAEELDAEYADAVANNDMERAQELVDQAARAAGYTERLYHGTPNGTFNVFRDWSYFTADKSYADFYQNQGASTNYKKTADNPRTYGVYVKIENAFDTRKMREKKIFQNEFYRKWGNGAPLSERGLPDWTDGDDLVEFFEENGYKYDAFLLDEGGTGGYDEEVKDRGISYIIKNPAQIKSADPVTYDDDGNVIPLIQRFNPRNEDIRYSADEPVTEEEVLRQKEVRRRANAMGLRNLRERVANLDGQIAGYERTGLTENMERELETLRTDRGIYQEALTKKEAKSQQAKTDRRNAKEAAEKAVDELSVMRTTARSRKILKKQIFDIYGIKHGFTEVGDSVDAFADTWIRQGKISYKAIEKMENMLMDLGEIRTESIDDHAREVRNRLSGGHISVPRSVVNEFSDDWDALRKRAFANGIYLSIDSHHTSIDQMTQDLAASFGKGRFDDSLSEKEQLENIIDIAEQGKAENLTVWQMAEYIAKMEGETASDYYIDDVHEQLMRSLKSFAQSAKIEMETVKRNVYNEVRRQTELKERMDRAQREREQREFQQKTLKQLQWLKRNQNFMGNDFQAEAKRILADIDTIAISAANEMNWSDKYQATWKDLAAMYKWAEKNDPNFLPSKELENIVMRVEGKHLDELSASDLEGIYKAAVALRTAYYNRNNVIGDELHRQFAEVFEDSVVDMKAAPKPKNKTGKGRNYLDQQLNPIHRINRMFGWKEESPGFQIFGRGLERGERLTKRYVEQATQMLDGWLTENEEWVRKSDGQGKEAIWYELEVPELMEFRMGDKPIFGKTVKVYMTPMQKIYLYLESKNYDNLRHIAGGRTFVNKELYSKGEYNEAFAQGTTVSLAPETVKKIVSDLTPTEMELANLLDKYFNGYAKTEINRVSNILYGYDRAMNDNYAPIFTNKNYNKSEPGIYQDGTAEGVGHMKTRVQGAKNPTYNISALDAFRRHVSQTSRFVGMAIPAQNATTLLNWSAGGVTMQDHITHNWNQKELTALENVMTELQAPTYQQESEFAGFLGKLMSKYIGGVFGANITVSAKVLASKATASIVLGGDAYPTIAQQRAVNVELVRKYTSELDVRIRGLGRPELAALTLDDSGYQKWVQSHKLTQLTLGGGLLQATDVYVARTLWAWSENRVRKDFPDLEVGTDEQVDAGMSPLYKKVAEVFDNAIGDTQSMYDIMHRSDIMRDTNELTRSFTIFHTDALQAINLVRMRAGKLTTAKANGSEAAINTEAKGLAAAIAGAALMHAIAVLFDAIRDIWKKRLDDYKDDEGDFTFWSVTSEILEQLAESMAGMLIGADAIIPAIEKKLKGETYYEHQLVAIDAFNDIIDGTGDFFKALGGFISGFANVISNGGDVWQYLTYDADFRGVVKDTAENIAHYLGGIPVKNVENLITNLLGWVWPQMAAAYDNIWATGSKSDLAKSADLDTDIKNLYDGKHELTDDMAAELARLYEAGYKNAIIRDTPDDFDIDGENVELDAADKQVYNDTVQQYLKPMGEIMQSPEYAMATDEEKAKMLNRLYDYAADCAKGRIVEDYELKSFTTSVMDWLDRGMSWAQIASGNTGDNNRLVKYVEAGVSDDIAEEIMNALDELEPEYGFKSVTAKQKVQTIAYMQITESEKEKAMSVAFGANGEKAYNRYMIARKNNVLSADYADFLEKLDKIDVNGGNPAQVEFIEAVAKSGFNTDAAREIWYTYWKSESPWG